MHEMYDSQTILQAKAIGCIIRMAACACPGHKEFTTAEVGPSVVSANSRCFQGPILWKSLLQSSLLGKAGRWNAFTAFWALLRSCGGQSMIYQ